MLSRCTGSGSLACDSELLADYLMFSGMLGCSKYSFMRRVPFAESRELL
jgi:hypothetical protein